METKNDNPINNVTWKGALLYLDKFIGRKVINLIEKNDISEEDAITLLGVSPNHIHLARKTYLLEQGGPTMTTSYGRRDVSWIRQNQNRDWDTHSWSTTI